MTSTRTREVVSKGLTAIVRHQSKKTGGWHEQNLLIPNTAFGKVQAGLFEPLEPADRLPKLQVYDTVTSNVDGYAALSGISRVEPATARRYGASLILPPDDMMASADDGADVAEGEGEAEAEAPPALDAEYTAGLLPGPNEALPPLIEAMKSKPTVAPEPAPSGAAEPSPKSAAQKSEGSAPKADDTPKEAETKNPAPASPEPAPEKPAIPDNLDHILGDG